MTKREKNIVREIIIFAMLSAAASVSGAMHILEENLPVSVCIAWGVICLPFSVAGFFPLKNITTE